MIEKAKVDKSIARKEPLWKPEVPDPSSSTGATSSSIYNNIYSLEGRVIQRNTYYTHSLKEKLKKRKSYIINFRVSEKELDILGELLEKRNTENLSQVIREAIRVYHGLLCNTGGTRITGSIVIQNPVINIVETRAESRTESKTEIKVDLTEIANLITRLYKLREPLPPLQRKLIEKIYNKLSKHIANN